MEFDQAMVEGIHSQTIINMDPPRHQKVRRIVRNAFTPKRVESYAPQFREHARRIVDAVARKGSCEFVEEVAAELPLIAILELLGVPLEDRKKFFECMSKRAGEMMKEDMEALGAVRLRDVEKAQQEIVAVARKLEEEGVIYTGGQAEDTYVT